ncbi:testis-expressed protein 13B [Saccopteryx leptura]|uniref:testis-expressed protein 13B n=1 Tax=Saccopteryx leptura TaxID=249018 RepID=UPI00339C3AD3
MAMRPEDPSTGFQHGSVLAFINEKMARHVKGPEFYLENISLSWTEVEDKLKGIIEDTAMTSEAKEACTWASLALGVCFACKQGQLHAFRVQRLHDYIRLHKSASQALATGMRELTERYEAERREADSQLRMTQAELSMAQKEKELLKWKLFQAEMKSAWECQKTPEEPSLATCSVFGTKGADEEKYKAWPAVTTTAAGAAEGKGRHKDDQGMVKVEGVKSVEGAKAVEELGGDLPQLYGPVGQKTHISERQRQGNTSSVETTTLYFSDTTQPRSTVPAATLPVQLPASYAYPFSYPFFPFPEALTPFPSEAGAPTQTSLYWGPSATGAQGTYQEPERNKKAFQPKEQSRLSVFNRPGTWKCPWCNGMNISWREICRHCDKGIWLQNA